jgi:hypothetical protein
VGTACCSHSSGTFAPVSRCDKPTESIDRAEGPNLSEAQSIVNKLRADHDFFMRELARAVGILRELPRPLGSADSEASFTSVHEAVLEIEKRLANHNQIEENQIYRWASTILTEAEQVDLATRINAELVNQPPRFSVEAWANEL